MSFEGFSEDTLGFLAELAAHNEREWFEANRARYERVLLGPELALVRSLGEAFSVIDSRVQCIPAVDASIYRIRRDTRFTRDKSPYKTYADLWFWIGRERKHAPGYFVRIVPEAVWVGGGMHFMTDAQLGRFRRAIDEQDRGADAARLVAELRDAGYEVGDETRKRMPVGFSAEHPRAALLRHTRLYALRKHTPVPPELFCDDFVSWCLEGFAPVSGLVDWLAHSVE